MESASLFPYKAKDMLGDEFNVIAFNPGLQIALAPTRSMAALIP
jgi:hypothetical protein